MVMVLSLPPRNVLPMLVADKVEDGVCLALPHLQLPCHISTVQRLFDRLTQTGSNPGPTLMVLFSGTRTIACRALGTWWWLQLDFAPKHAASHEQMDLIWQNVLCCTQPMQA